MSDRDDLWEVHVPEGAHLAESRDTDGTYRALLFSDEDNSMMGPPEMRKVHFGIDGKDEYRAGYYDDDDDDDYGERGHHDDFRDEMAALLAQAVVEALHLLVVKGGPVVVRWWASTGKPGAIRRWKGLLSVRIMLPKRGTKKSVDSTPADIPKPAAALTATVSLDEFSTAVDKVLAEPRTTMSREEADRRHLAMMMAIAFASEQIRILANADIRDEGRQALQHAAESFTSPEILKSTNQMLEANPNLLSKKAREQFQIRFGGGFSRNGSYVPLMVDQVTEAFRLDTK